MLIEPLEFGDSTVIEIFGTSPINEFIGIAENVADWIEIICILTFSLANERHKIENILQIKEHKKTLVDLTIGLKYYHLRSKMKKISSPKGLTIDKQFLSRYKKCGFELMENICYLDDKIHKRIVKSLKWLCESRTDPVLESAIVKTAIALESLLIFDENEALAKSLSDRMAILVSNDLHERKKISKHIKEFYAARSGIVHGSKAKSKLISPDILEAVDSLVILACLILVHNFDKWNTEEKLKDSFEEEKFGSPDKTVRVPFSKAYVSRAINRLSPREA